MKIPLISNICPDCNSNQLGPPDDMGWRMCAHCGSDFAPDYDTDDPE